MSGPVSRREALARVGKAAGVLAAGGVIAHLAHDEGGLDVARAEGERVVRDFRLPPDREKPEIAIARGGTPESLTRAAIAAMGGMRRFVSRGDVVVVKPNIGWDRVPMQAANTNPVVVSTLVELCHDAGAKRVVVTDVSCNDPNRCFQRSGIWRAVHAKGGEVVLPAERRFRRMRLGGELLDEWPVYVPLIEADKLVNAPVAKHHNLAGFTAAMKNWYGCLGGRRNRLHQSIDLSIADLAAFMRPTLTIVDGYRVLLRNGPQGGNIDDTARRDTVIASVDEVAADALASTLVDPERDPRTLPYLEMGQERGLGTMDWRSLRVREVTG